MVNRAVRRGELVRPDVCENCGFRRRGVEAHHGDYAQPLAVQWLCRECHKAWHAANGPGRNDAEVPPLRHEPVPRRKRPQTEYGKRLRSWRSGLGLLPVDVAVILGCSEAAIRYREKSRNWAPFYYELQKLEQRWPGALAAISGSHNLDADE